jgi:hypothetical protein
MYYIICPKQVICIQHVYSVNKTNENQVKSAYCHISKRLSKQLIACHTSYLITRNTKIPSLMLQCQ